MSFVRNSEKKGKDFPGYASKKQYCCFKRGGTKHSRQAEVLHKEKIQFWLEINRQQVTGIVPYGFYPCMTTSEGLLLLTIVYTCINKGFRLIDWLIDWLINWLCTNSHLHLSPLQLCWFKGKIYLIFPAFRRRRFRGEPERAGSSSWARTVSSWIASWNENFLILALKRQNNKDRVRVYLTTNGAKRTWSFSTLFRSF